MIVGHGYIKNLLADIVVQIDPIGGVIVSMFTSSASCRSWV